MKAFTLMLYMYMSFQILYASENIEKEMKKIYHQMKIDIDNGADINTTKKKIEIKLKKLMIDFSSSVSTAKLSKKKYKLGLGIDTPLVDIAKFEREKSQWFHYWEGVQKAHIEDYAKLVKSRYFLSKKKNWISKKWREASDLSTQVSFITGDNSTISHKKDK